MSSGSVGSHTHSPASAVQGGPVLPGPPREVSRPSVASGLLGVFAHTQRPSARVLGFFALRPGRVQPTDGQSRDPPESLWEGTVKRSLQWGCRHFAQPAALCRVGVPWATCNGKSHNQRGLLLSCHKEFWPG